MAIASVIKATIRTLFEAGGRGVRRALAIPFALFVFAAFVPAAAATDWTFDWATQGWSPTGAGSMPRTYVNVAGSGIDVQVTASITGCSWLSGYPALNTLPGQGSELNLRMQSCSSPYTTDGATITINFFQTGTGQTVVKNVAIKGIAVRDVDRDTGANNYQDVVKVTGVDQTSTTINPDFISDFVNPATPNWTASNNSPPSGSNNTITATGTSGIAETNQAGWAAFNFATKTIHTLTLFYNPGDGGSDSPTGQQWLWISNFVFSDVALTTRAVISDVRAHVEDGQPWVEWQTASEIGTAGFNVYRLDPAGNRFIRLNDRLLPALVEARRGGLYRYPDPGIVAGGTYTYGLEEVEARGTTRFYGPYTVTAGAGTPRAASNKAQSLAADAKAAAPPAAGFQRHAHALNGRVAPPHAAITTKKAAALATWNTAIRILVEQDGVYTVSAGQIAAALGADVRKVRTWIGGGKLRLQQKGKRVAWMPGAGNDQLYFYGQAVQGDDRVYTRYNVYWLDQAAGVTMKVLGRSGPKTVATGTPYFPSHIHVEDNDPGVPPTPLYWIATDPNADFWYWDYVSAEYGRGAVDFKVPVPDPVGVGTATLSAYLQGTTDLVPGDDHHAHLVLNGTEVGDVAWDGINPKVLSATFDAGLLAPGGDNTVTVVGDVPVTAFSVFWVKGFDIDYPRAFKATDDRLRLRGAGNALVTVSGFSGPNIAVLDISDPLKPKWLAATTIDALGNAVSFVPATPTTDYVAAVAAEPVAIQGDTPTTLRGKNHGASYLVLTPASLRTGADALAAYRGGMVVELQDIYDEFNYGIANPNAIRDFLAYANANWHPRPWYVALVGKGTIDPKDYLGYGTNLFPVLMTPTPDGLFNSDNRYVDFSDNGVPDVTIARVPALTDDDVTNYVAKLTAYDNNGGSAGHALLVADKPDDAGDFTADIEAAEAAFQARSFTTTSVLLSQTPADDARQAIIDTLNSGAGVFNYGGHGSTDLLSDEHVFTSADVSRLTNGARMVFLAFTCLVGDGSYPGYDSLAETMLWSQAGGAVAAFAPTGLSNNTQAHTLNLGMVDALFGAHASPTLGDAAKAALTGLATNGADRYMLEIYSVIGDPALRVHP